MRKKSNPSIFFKEVFSSCLIENLAPGLRQMPSSDCSSSPYASASDQCKEIVGNVVGMLGDEDPHVVQRVLACLPDIIQVKFLYILNCAT